jgi:predicted alpha/beta-fold hydrolase
MTLYGWGNPRYFPRLPAPTRRYFDVAADANGVSRVVAECHWQPRPWERVTVLALHGLNGSSDAHYVRGLASKAFARGMNVVRLNQRNCGGTEHLTPGLFHSGLTGDVAHVMRELETVDGLPTFAIAGWSLGGNLALKLAGEFGDYAPESIVAVAAVSPILEISRCVHALERPGNVLYQWNFVRDLKKLMRSKNRFWPGRYDMGTLDSVRTVREFDRMFTAPHFGFRDEEDYYHRASAMRLASRIRVPSLVITAEDDPFVPPEPFASRDVLDNPAITTRVFPHGGHCGFIAARSGEDDGYWAEDAILNFFEARLARLDSSARLQPSLVSA